MKITNEAIQEKIRSLSKQKAAAIFRETRAIAKNENLEIGGKEISFIPIPYVVAQSKTNKVFEALDFFISMFLRIEDYALSQEGSPLYQRLMNSLTDGGRYLVNQCNFESKFSLRRRLRRIDGYLNPSDGNFSMIEINQAAPLALHFYDTIQEIGDYVLTQLGFSPSENKLAPHLLDWFLDEYKYRYDNKPQRIALVIEHGYPPKFTDLPNAAKRCQKIARDKYDLDLLFETCFPYELQLQKGEVKLKGERVDMIWRNSVYLTKYKQEGLNLSDYESICSNTKHNLIINSTRAWLTRTKEVFAIIWDDDACDKIGFSDDELNKIRKLVPHSVNLAYSPSAKEKIISEKNSWISKPTDAGFGQGVEFGEWYDTRDWEHLVASRAAPGYVFQKRVEYPKTNLLDISETGDVVEKNVEFDFCPHHVNGKFSKTVLSRANVINESGKSAKMNLVGGGVMLPILMA